MPVPAASRQGSRRIWGRVVIAYLLSGPVALAWINHFKAGADNEEALNVAFTALGLLSFALGIPALLVAWGALKQARRLPVSARAIHQARAVRTAVGVLFALWAAGLVVAQLHINREQSHVQDRASPSMFDRSGLAAIQHRGHTYRNPNDRCSPATGLPPVIVACTAQNRPPVRTRAWLIAHHDWPLTVIGEVRFPNSGVPGPGWGQTGAAHSILRPSAQDNPAFLLVASGSSYLEYLRV